MAEIVNAQTVLLIPVDFGQDNLSSLENRLLDKEVEFDSFTSRVWKTKDPENRSSQQYIRNFKMSKKVKNIIFPNTFITTDTLNSNHNTIKKEYLKIKIKNVELLLSFTCVGLIRIHIGLMVQQNKIIEPDILKKWLMKIINHSIDNTRSDTKWILNYVEKNKIIKRYSTEELYFGSITNSILYGDPTSLDEIVNWMVELSNTINKPIYHHTKIVFSDKLENDFIDHYFSTFTNSPFLRGEIINLNINTLMMLYPGGLIHITWPSQDLHPPISWDIYLPLVEQNVIWKAILTQLSSLSINLIKEYQDNEFEDNIINIYNKMKQIIMLTKKTILWIDNDNSDCYYHNYISKKIGLTMNIFDLKKVVDKNITDLFSIINTINNNYQNSITSIENQETQISEKKNIIKMAAGMAQRNVMQLVLMMIPSITLPMILVTNYFTLTVPSAPSINYWVIFGISIVAAIGIIVLIATIWYCCFKKMKKNKQKYKSWFNNILDKNFWIDKGLEEDEIV